MTKTSINQYKSIKKSKEEKIIEEFAKVLIDVIEKEIKKGDKKELLEKIKDSKKEDKPISA